MMLMMVMQWVTMMHDNCDDVGGEGVMMQMIIMLLAMDAE
jgi:hypothetical protein